MDSPAATVRFWRMSVAEIRQWVEAHPHHVNDTDGCGMTALFTAATAPRRDLILVRWLIEEHNADVNARNDDGRTALHWIERLPPCMQRYEQSTELIFTYLLAHGADATLVDGSGWTPLMRQAQSRSLVILRLLVDELPREELDARVPAGAGRGGSTALHLAIHKRNMEAARLLVEAGASPDLEDGEGRTPREVLVEDGHDDDVELMEELEEEVWAERCATLLLAIRLRVEAGQEVVLLEQDERVLAYLAGMSELVGGVFVPDEIFCLVLDRFLPGWSILRLFPEDMLDNPLRHLLPPRQL